MQVHGFAPSFAQHFCINPALFEWTVTERSRAAERPHRFRGVAAAQARASGKNPAVAQVAAVTSFYRSLSIF
jgi:hypothetical protein